MNLILVRSVFLAVPLLAAQFAAAELPTPKALVAQSIAYHDPAGVWARGSIQLEVHTTYSPALARERGIETSEVRIWLSPANETFRYVTERKGSRIEYSMRRGEGATLLDGRAEISPEDRERLRLAAPDLYRDYCEYVYGMPMKLLDPGARLDPAVKSAQLAGREAHVLRVTYDPEVGEDVWDFYFDPETSALIGYRFFHDESANDGEYIVFEGEVRDERTGLRLPRARAWYYNSDGGHLATDDVVSMVCDLPTP